MKRCTGCKLDLSADAFGPDRTKVDGLSTRCRECRRASNREAYWRDPETRRAKCSASARAAYAANLEEKRAKSREKGRRFRRENPTSVRRSRKEWATRNPEKVRARAARQRLSNPERAREHVRKWRVRKAGLRPLATLEQIRARIEFYGGRCYLCRVPYEALDHVKPISKGGSDLAANIRPICKSCNSRKRSKWPFAPAFRRREQ